MVTMETDSQLKSNILKKLYLKNTKQILKKKIYTTCESEGRGFFKVGGAVSSQEGAVLK